MIHKHPRAAEVTLTERQWRIYRFLSANPAGVLSSVSPDGDPHGTVVYFSIDKSFKLCFLTKDGTRKYDNLKRNNHVMLTVFEPASQTTVQIEGVAYEITDSVDVNAVAGAVLSACLKTSNSGMVPITNLQAGSYVAFRIKPKLIRMAVYSDPKFGDYAELFESVESFDLELS